MKGFAYKELIQRKIQLLFVMVFPAVISFMLPVWFLKNIGDIKSHDNEKVKSIMSFLKERNDTDMWLLCILIAFLITGMIQGLIFEGDDKRVFGFFLTSTPDGVKRYIKTKYELGFVMILLTLFSLQLGDWIMTIVSAAYDVEWHGFAEVMIYLSFLQIVLRAFEYPFTVRFGVKAGSYIKTALGTLLALITAAVFIIFEDKLVPFFSGFSLKKLSKGANVFVSVFPVLSVLLYIVSFKISCKLYPKGVERYDK